MIVRSNGASVDPTSDVPTAVMLVLLILRSCADL